MKLPLDLTLLTNARLQDGSLVDVVIDGDTVTEVRPATQRPESATTSGASSVIDGSLDLDGYLLLTASAEPHAHLDKALSWSHITPKMGDLEDAIRSWQSYTDTMTVESIAERAREEALALLSNGITAVRSHVDLLLGDEPLRGVHALLQVREELKDLIDIELVALGNPFTPSAQYEAAIDAGFDLMGGAPHRAPEPLDEVRRLLDIADKYGIGIDLHTDENLYGAYTLPQFARWVRDWDRKTRPVTAGHCVRLSTLDADQLADVIAEVKASDIGLIALPITNLYLQGWEHPVATPRGIAPVRALLDAGVRVAGGADNVRDPFNPLGRSDPFETAMLLVTASHLTFTEAYEAVSASARDVMSLPEAGARPGAKAEFLAIKAHDLGDAVATAPADRLVIHRGRLVSQTTTNRVTAW